MERLRSWVTSRMPADVHAYISWFTEFHQDELDQPPVRPAKEKKKDDKAKNKGKKKSGKKNK